MAEVDRLFNKLITEAVAVCGADVACVTAHVEEHMGKLSPDQQIALSRMIERVTGFREPEKPFREQ